MATSPRDGSEAVPVPVKPEQPEPFRTGRLSTAVSGTRNGMPGTGADRTNYVHGARRPLWALRAIRQAELEHGTPEDSAAKKPRGRRGRPRLPGDRTPSGRLKRKRE